MKDSFAYYFDPPNVFFQAEAALLKLLKNSAGKKLMSDTIERFNCNVPYSGLLHSVTQDVCYLHFLINIFIFKFLKCSIMFIF